VTHKRPQSEIRYLLSLSALGLSSTCEQEASNEQKCHDTCLVEMNLYQIDKIESAQKRGRQLDVLHDAFVRVVATVHRVRRRQDRGPGIKGGNDS
jgi:hypothetical protein